MCGISYGLQGLLRSRLGFVSAGLDISIWLVEVVLDPKLFNVHRA